MDGIAVTHLWLNYEAAAGQTKNTYVGLARSPQLIRPVLASLTVLGLCAVPLSALARTVYVDTPAGYALNARWGPGTDYGIQSTLMRGSPLQLSGRYSSGWAQLTNGTWVANSYISSGALPAGRTAAYVDTPAGYSLNTRWGPGMGYGIYRAIARGSQVILTGQQVDGWAQLSDATWAWSSYLRPGTAATPETAASTPVVELQNRLKLLGYLPFDYPSSGVYDATTQDAVRRFQRVNNLTPDGIVGPATWEAIYRSSDQFTSNPAPSPSPTPAPTPPTALPPQAVIDLQNLLKQIDYLPADYPVSGTYDATTQDAVRRFQRDSNLTAAGVVGPATWQALYQRQAQLPSPSPTATPTPSPTATVTPTPAPTATATPSPSPSPTMGGQQMQVAADGEDIQVFDGPGSEYERLRSIPSGSMVTTTGRVSGNWSELADGGWVFTLWLQAI